MKHKENDCLGCGQQLPEPFLDLGNTPLANALIKQEHSELEEPVFRLAVTHCPFCQLVQLTDIVPPEKMFTEYLYFSSYSESFLNHAQKLAETLTKQFLQGSNKRVLEIGSNDGYLLQYFKPSGISILGVEPSQNIADKAKSRGIPTLNRFFGADAVEEIRKTFGEADIIIGNNVLAHVPQINDFLLAVKACLNSSGIAVFEFPYIRDLLNKTEFDTIYHEHVFYFSLSSIKKLIERAGLQFFDVSHQSVHGGSLRVFLQKSETHPIKASAQEMLADEQAEGLNEPSRFYSFGHDVMDLKKQLLDLLWSLKESGKRIAAYGAPAKGNTLLNFCGITKDLLEFTVDRNPHKQGLLCPGSRLCIRHSDELIKEMPDYTMILPWNIADEIMAQQQEYQKKGGKFIIPIPKPMIV